MNISVEAVTGRQEFVPEDPRFHLDLPATGTPIAGPPGITRASLPLVIESNDSAPPQDLQGLDHDLLKDSLDRVLKDVLRFPNSTRAHANAGLAFLNCDKVDEAVREFQAALNIDQENYVALTNLARVRVTAGQLDDAQALYSRLLVRFPTDRTALISLAHIALLRNRPHEALNQLEHALAHRKDVELVHFYLGHLYLRLNRLNEAIAQFRKAARSNVRTPAFYHGLGVAYAAAGDLGRAARSFRTALAISPSRIVSMHALATVLIDMKDFDNAIALLNERLRAGDDPEARELLGRAFYGLKDFRSCARELYRVLVLSDRDDSPRTRSLRAHVLNNIGVCFAKLGDWAHAKQHFIAATAAPNDVSLPHLNLARAYLREKAYRQALEVLERALASFPNDIELQVVHATALHLSGQDDQAISTFEDILRRDNAPVSAFAVFGSILVDENQDPEEAIQVLRRGWECFPSNELIGNNLAYAYLMSGDPESARRILSSIKSEENAPVVLAATWGLLRLWEDDPADGSDRYRQAASLAKAGGDRELAETVRQKMHLELARFWFRHNDRSKALHEIEVGLRLKGKQAYRRDLVALRGEG